MRWVMAAPHAWDGWCVGSSGPVHLQLLPSAHTTTDAAVKDPVSCSGFWLDWINAQLADWRYLVCRSQPLVQKLDFAPPENHLPFNFSRCIISFSPSSWRWVLGGSVCIKWQTLMVIKKLFFLIAPLLAYQQKNSGNRWGHRYIGSRGFVRLSIPAFKIYEFRHILRKASAQWRFWSS